MGEWKEANFCGAAVNTALMNASSQLVVSRSVQNKRVLVCSSDGTCALTGDVHALGQHTHKHSIEFLTFLRQKLQEQRRLVGNHHQYMSHITDRLRICGIDFGQLQEELGTAEALDET